MEWKTAPGTKGHSPQSVSDQADCFVRPLDDERVMRCSGTPGLRGRVS